MKLMAIVFQVGNTDINVWEEMYLGFVLYFENVTVLQKVL